MPRLTPEQRLEKAKAAKEAALIEMRRAAGQLSAQSRKLDTRRKILIGAAILRDLSKVPGMSGWLKKAISEMPERDQAVFEGFNIPESPRPAPAKKKEIPDSSST